MRGAGIRDCLLRMTTKAPTASDRPVLQIIRKAALRERLGGCSDHHIDDLETREGFPRHIRIGGRSVGWLEHEVDDWITRRMAARDDETKVEQAKFDRAPPAVHHRLRQQREQERAEEAELRADLLTASLTEREREGVGLISPA